MMKFSVVVPTLNTGFLWHDWIVAIKKQSVKADKVLVIDSGSTDDTVKFALLAKFDLEVIQKKDFGHGKTRQLAVGLIDKSDVLVFMTQDAILHDSESINNMLKLFSDDNVAAVCGRQLPRLQATPNEAHARLYNYSSKSFTRSIEDVGRFGLKTAFLSNSFAAYRMSALIEVGGFPEDVIFGEDMYVAANLLKAGYKVAYAANACVCHSHNYSIWQEFKRYFDMGVFHAREPWIRAEFGNAEGEGVKFVVSELKYLLKHAFWRIPETLLRTVLRYTGFRVGLLEKRLPLQLKRLFAMNKGYFEE